MRPHRAANFLFGISGAALFINEKNVFCLILPVSVTTGERSFSKLKLTKTYLRSTMNNERLYGLTVISVEHDKLAKN